MAHIHTLPGQHDMTVSAYIVRMQDDTPLVLVHMHKKFRKLMQAGGHIELTETPWGAIAHEILEETGYALGELSVLQPVATPVMLPHSIIHPLPLLVNTHKVSPEHLHTDSAYAFVAQFKSKQSIAQGESEDIRWLTIDELKLEVDAGRALDEVYKIYKAIIEQYLEAYDWVAADVFSVEDPKELVLPEVTTN